MTKHILLILNSVWHCYFTATWGWSCSSQWKSEVSIRTVSEIGGKWTLWCFQYFKKGSRTRKQVCCCLQHYFSCILHSFETYLCHTIVVGISVQLVVSSTDYSFFFNFALQTVGDEKINVTSYVHIISCLFEWSLSSKVVSSVIFAHHNITIMNTPFMAVQWCMKQWRRKWGGSRG